ncbi:hypothetical protein M413DRAFT_22984 [Hebeloma cylindrosporum]|uniref:Uncharacterized protein n=1 Tax=Hebeloma cylindrosporum TaxID=76867 RepID=A0A0C3CXD9_HEBCY|nr:hypothetical protein M413DRAFT_22984 [Hebeloma cylindrosporum h7]
MGLLSFKVAALPNWFNLLAEKGVPQIWLHDFRLSTACSFSEGCPHVSIILDWLDHNNKNQSPPEWFTSHYVPVWYPWTPAHAQASSNPRFAHLRPPVEILQVATTFSPIPPPSQSRQQQPAPINPAPPTTVNTSAHMTPKEFDAARKAYIRTKPWTPFFEAQAKQNEIQLENETLQQRQTRLNQERKPPTISAEVYEWDWSDEDPLVLVRTCILSRCREDTLDLYKESQCRYDAFRNAWDICEWFDLDDRDNSAPMDTDNEDDDEFTGGSVGGYDSGGDIDEDCNPEEEQAAHSRYIANRMHEISTSWNAISWPSTQSHADIEVDLSEDRNPFELLTHLEVFYGYASPLETNSSPWIQKDWDDSMKAIGWFVDDNPPLKDFEAIVIKFIKDFTSSNPPPQNFNFNLQNYHLPTDQFFYRKNRVVYVLKADSFMDGKACPYSIALTNARDAIFIYRHCQFLWENGIPFRTLQHLDRVPVHRMLNNDETLIPIRLSGYQFGLRDYEAYIRHRAQLLTSPRGRAALLRGGIVAQLAREHIETDSTLFGPSSAMMVHRLGIHIVENNGSELWDDHLMENEIGIICGLHRCYTGHGAQMSQESWWPMPSLWENEKVCSLNWGHWTQWDEQWYLMWLKDIAKGSKEGVPFPAHIWQTKVRGIGAGRVLNKNISESSNRVFDRVR